MSGYPAEDAAEQEIPFLPEDDTTRALLEHGLDVDPSESYELDRPVPLDEDEWR